MHEVSTVAVQMTEVSCGTNMNVIALPQVWYDRIPRPDDAVELFEASCLIPSRFVSLHFIIPPPGRARNRQGYRC